MGQDNEFIQAQRACGHSPGFAEPWVGVEAIPGLKGEPGTGSVRDGFRREARERRAHEGRNRVAVRP